MTYCLPGGGQNTGDVVNDAIQTIASAEIWQGIGAINRVAGYLKNAS